MNGNHSWLIGKCKHLVKSTDLSGLKLTSHALLVRRFLQSNLQALEHQREFVEASSREVAMPDAHMTLLKRYLRIIVWWVLTFMIGIKIEFLTLYKHEKPTCIFNYCYYYFAELCWARVLLSKCDTREFRRWSMSKCIEETLSGSHLQLITMMVLVVFSDFS